MKLLSTLITALALTASVFTAPKALAADPTELPTTCTITWQPNPNKMLTFDFGDAGVIAIKAPNASIDKNNKVIDLTEVEGCTGDEWYSSYNGGYFDAPMTISSITGTISYAGVDFQYDANSNYYYTGCTASEGFEFTLTGTIGGTEYVLHYKNDVAPEGPATSEDLEITAALYATYFNKDHDVTLPEGLEGYVPTWDGSRCVFEKAFDKERGIPAKTPVLLKAESAGTYTLAYEAAEAFDNSHNCLHKSGTSSFGMGMEGYYNGRYYGLSKGKDDPGDYSTVGFYWRAEGGAAFNFFEEGKAYLSLPAAAGARILFADEITGITDIRTEQAAPAARYNIMGIRMQEAKGLVVSEGKLMYVK